MQLILYLAALFTAVSALPAFNANADVCGPTSNCEVVDTDGTEAYRFKPGFEPGSPAYENRLVLAPSRPSGGASLFNAREAKTHTTVVMGKTQMHKSWDVDKWEGDQKAPSGAQLRLKLEGKYATKNSHDALLEALLATATDESAQTEKKTWMDRATE
ncbi:hypothetical protein PG994_008349 [Apiospora phragmitis]|uniref:Uncharacterized protein n=1 Tax=Apiospora phragmitis TaxID=2905665 RepID=A0ABR1UVX0_9PEZI